MKKILLTGATGFLGKYFYRYLKSTDNLVDTLGRSPDSTINADFKSFIPPINTKYDFVIHSAGKAHSIPKNKKEEKEFFDINYNGTVNLCNSLEKKLPKNFIFISTIAVYGKNSGVKISENEKLNGHSAYAISKIKAERYLLEWSKSKKVNLVILRLPLVAGKRPKGNLRSMINGIRKGYYFNISKSNALKSVVLAKDVAELLPNLDNKNGIYNLAGDKDYSIIQISEIISKQLSNKKVYSLPFFFVNFISFLGDLIPFIPFDSITLEKMSNSLTVSDSRSRNELNWSPSNLEDEFKIF